MELIVAGFFLGFLGSAHCAGMCGPIAVALPGQQAKKTAFISGRVLYNSGRTLTYMFLGFFAGLLGLSAALAGYQQWVSILAGVSIILMAIFGKKYMHVSPAYYSAWFGRQFKKLLASGNPSSLFGIGLMNGFLPCGFVYLGLAGSIGTGNPISAALFMGLFGLGTFPVMMAMAMAPRLLKSEWRHRMVAVLPVAAILLGCLLILRGLSLGIPFISPDLSAGGMDCH